MTVADEDADIGGVEIYFDSAPAVFQQLLVMTMMLMRIEAMV